MLRSLVVCLYCFAREVNHSSYSASWYLAISSSFFSISFDFANFTTSNLNFFSTSIFSEIYYTFCFENLRKSTALCDFSYMINRGSILALANNFSSVPRFKILQSLSMHTTVNIIYIYSYLKVSNFSRIKFAIIYFPLWNLK